MAVIWLLYSSHKWMLERRFDILIEILMKIQKFLDVLSFIKTHSQVSHDFSIDA